MGAGRRRVMWTAVISQLNPHHSLSKSTARGPGVSRGPPLQSQPRSRARSCVARALVCHCRVPPSAQSIFLTLYEHNKPGLTQVDRPWIGCFCSPQALSDVPPGVSGYFSPFYRLQPTHCWGSTKGRGLDPPQWSMQLRTARHSPSVCLP